MESNLDQVKLKMEKTIPIICVDDDIIVHHLLTRVLELAGIKVLAWFKSAEELLEMRSEEKYRDAVMFLFDYQMPNMTGVELAKKLRTEGEQRPILLTSAFSKDHRWRLNELNVEYMQKPYDFEELESLIKNLAYQSVTL
jgi:two-component system response regulator MprA